MTDDVMRLLANGTSTLILKQPDRGIHRAPRRGRGAAVIRGSIVLPTLRTRGKASCLSNSVRAGSARKSPWLDNPFFEEFCL